MFRTVCLSTAIVLMLCSIGAAQRVVHPAFVPTRGYGYPYGYGYSSTPAEGYQRGMADVIRAKGEASEDISRARINNAEAQDKYIDNHNKWLDLRREQQAKGKAVQEREYHAKRAAYEQTQQKYKEYNESLRPKPLSPNQLDVTTGTIHWPRALGDSKFAAERMQMEELFQTWAHTDSHNELTSEIQSLAKEMEAELRKNMRGMSANDYIAAKHFLEGLVRAVVA